MRRFLVIGLDAFQFQRLHGARLALNFLLQPVEQFALLDDDGVQLLDLVFEVRKVCLKFFGAPGIFVCHAAILPARRREVETMKWRAVAAIWWGERPREPTCAKQFARLARTPAPPTLQLSIHQITDCAAAAFSQSYPK